MEREDTVAALVRAGAGLLGEGAKTQAYAGAQAKAEARALLGGLLGCSGEQLTLCPERVVTAERVEEYRAGLERLRRGAPLAYVLGQAWFMGLPFSVDQRVLIPRPDTERLVEAALERLGPGDRVLEVGTGSGAIAVTLARAPQRPRVTATELSPGALAVAEENARRHGAGIRFAAGDLWAGETGPFELIVSNPPYIASGAIAGLEASVADYEPHMALDGGEDGLDFYRRLTGGAKERLSPGGWLMVEIGWDQGVAVTGLFREEGYRNMELRRDWEERDRVVIGRKG